MSQSVPRCGFPREIDALVVDTREEVLHFDPSIGWARHAAASLDPNAHAALISWGQDGAHEPDLLIQHVRIPVTRPV